jgi:hypothetical protein
MKRSALAAAIMTCLLAGATVVSAQLGEVARKEAERRKTAKTGKTYTNDSVKPDPSSAAVPAASGATTRETPTENAPASSSAPDAKSETPPQVSSDPAQRKAEEAQWREKIKGAREALERAKSFADALQSKINALNTDFVNRDDPAQRAKIAQDRDKALADMGQAKKEIEQHTKAIAKIQEDARRAGVPAGWVR